MSTKLRKIVILKIVLRNSFGNEGNMDFATKLPNSFLSRVKDFFLLLPENVNNTENILQFLMNLH